MDKTADETMPEKRSESWRHQCEVRWLLRRIDQASDKRKTSDEYIGLVRKSRGDDAADKLLADVRAQWSKGNRGAEGLWK